MTNEALHKDVYKRQAVYRVRRTPFYILDEVEAALDDTNLRRLLSYLDSIRSSTQFIIISHQRRTMEMADLLYGCLLYTSRCV